MTTKMHLHPFKLSTIMPLLSQINPEHNISATDKTEEN